MTRVLVVARWYPSHDVPHRGAFVADLVDAIRGSVDQVVVSWEPALVRGEPAGRSALVEHAEDAWRPSIVQPWALNAATEWGAAGVPVARLPVLDDPDRRTPAVRIERHAALLGPFAEALARGWPIDLVHAHTGIPDGLAAAATAERLGVPMVVTEHASDLPGLLAGDAAAAARYRDLAIAPRRRLTAVSTAFARRIVAAAGLDPGAITVVPNSVPIDRFPVADWAARDPDELLWVGERSAKKGTEVLLRAFASVRAMRPALALRLIGSAPTQEIEERWLALAGELGVADAVTFDPPADRAAVAQAMGRAAVLVHPSPAETFGMVAAEALATGLPVVATPSGGVDEIVGSDGACGEVADGFDDQALAIALDRLLDRRAELDPMAMRRRIEDEFAPPAVARRLRAIYDELLEPASSRRRRVGERDAGPPATAPPPGREEPMFVVGLNRTLLERRLTALENATVRGLTVVTTGPTGPTGIGPRPGMTLVVIDPDVRYRRTLARSSGPRLAGLGRLPGPIHRVARALLDPGAALRRRRLVRERAALRAAELVAGVRDAWARHVAGLATRDPAWIVACDAEDVAAIESLLGADRARLAPGSLRWLADRRSAGRDLAGRADRAP